ncbi:MAG: DUF819 family protein [Henriciella sp.]|nr:DUF819 family protein [Henriciella sp.]
MLDISVDLWAALGLLGVLAFSFWLTRYKAAAWLSPPVVALILTAIFVNIGLMPKGGTSAVYDFVFGPGLMAAIFLLMLQVDMSVFRRAGPAMGMMFVIGTVAVAIGVMLTLLVPYISSTLGEDYPTLAGMYGATYTGGSVNFNSVAAIKDISRDDGLFAVAVGVDNLMGSTAIAFSILIAPFLARWWKNPDALHAPTHEDVPDTVSATPLDLAIAGVAATAAIILAQVLNDLIPQIHPVLWLTTIALIAAQTPLGRLGLKLEPIAIVALYLFIAAIGTDVSYPAIMGQLDIAFAAIVLVAIVMLVHYLAIFTLGKRVSGGDAALVMVASQANIGGPPTALAVADALGRKDLRIPGVAAGLLGYATGTYLGVTLSAIIGSMV